MWWDKSKLLNQAREVFKLKKFEGKSMYLAIANTMFGETDTARVQKDTTGITTHIRSILELKNILQHNPQNGLNWTYKYYNADSHGSVPLIAEYDAIHFLFSFYNMPSGVIAIMIDKKSKTDVAALIDSHYQDISKHMGYRILPSEDMLTGMGYFLLSTNQPEKAYAIFNLNIKDYPDSFNVYNVMGDYYDNQKNKAKAIEYYTRSLKIKENSDTRRKLEKLVASK
jgi:tetratricopeptide (TPR) repeat protein